MEETGQVTANTGMTELSGAAASHTGGQVSSVTADAVESSTADAAASAARRTSPESVRKMHASGSAADTSYERFAESYIPGAEVKPHTAFYERPAVAALIPERLDGAHAVDLGCGTGYFTELLAARGARVTAVDASRKMLDHTHGRAGDGVRCLLADISEPMPDIESGSADIIVASLVLHYARDLDRVFEELARILKPGGRLVFSVHHPTADYLLFKRRGYFDTELVEDEWNGFPGGPLKVRFYVRPMCDVMNPMTGAGLRLERFVEPRPVEECREKFPKVYEKLNREPAFLVISAVK